MIFLSKPESLEPPPAPPVTTPEPTAAPEPVAAQEPTAVPEPAATGVKPSPETKAE